MIVEISPKTKAKLYPPQTPISDKMAAQKPPEGCSKEQWQQYVAKVRANEVLGFPNPEFGVEKPWMKTGCIRNVRRIG